MKKLLSAFIAVMLFCSIIPVAEAASLNASVSTASDHIEIGDTISVSLSAVSDVDMSGMFVSLSYPAKTLAYVSGDATGSDGTLTIKQNFTEAHTKFSAGLTFKALAEGDAKISAEFTAYDAEIEPIKIVTDTLSFSVNAHGTQSGDCTLKYLSASYGSLSPVFDRDTTQYSLSVPNSVSSVTITAEASDPNATVLIGGISELAVGMNARNITVTAPNGTKRVYQVTILREEGENSGSESNTPTESDNESLSPRDDSVIIDDTAAIKVNGLSHYLTDVPENYAIPASFVRKEWEYKGNSFEILQTSDGVLKLLYLTDYKGQNGNLYYYNEERDVCEPCAALFRDHSTYVVLDASDVAKIPTGYKKISAILGKRSVIAFVKEKTDNNSFVLLAVNAAGERGYYDYNTKNGQITPYTGTFEIDPNVAESEPETSSDPKQNESTEVSAQPLIDLSWIDFSGPLPYYVLGGFLLLCIILALIIILVRVGAKRKAEEADETFIEDAVMSEQVTLSQSDDEDFRPGDAKWKDVTMRVPLTKMTEVATTSLKDIHKAAQQAALAESSLQATMLIPSLEETDYITPAFSVEVPIEEIKKTAPAQAPSVEEVTAEPEGNEETEAPRAVNPFDDLFGEKPETATESMETLSAPAPTLDNFFSAEEGETEEYKGSLSPDDFFRE